MAIDTALKRFSITNLTMPWRGHLVVPDVTFPQGERQASQWQYGGILWSSAAPPVSTASALFTLLFRRRRRQRHHYGND